MALQMIAETLWNNRKWIITPLAGKGDGEGKTPVLKDWQKQYSVDLSKTWQQQWIELNPNNSWVKWEKFTNIGVVCGKTSGIVVFDIDLKDNGVALWEECLKIHPNPKTLTAITGGGGYHYYFKYDQRTSHLKSKSKCIDDANGGPTGWDIKTNGGQVVIPPSIHRNGKSYTWVDENAEIIDMPSWILEMLNIKDEKLAKVKRANKVVSTIETNVDKSKTNQSVPSTAATVNATTSDLGKISGALDLLSSDYYDKYDEWFKVLLALKSFSNADNDFQLSELWHEFSLKSDKYSESECINLWNTTVPREGGITIASLYFWAKECNPEGYAALCPQKRVILNIIKELPPYDPKEEYYWYDYVKEFNKKKYNIDVTNHVSDSIPGFILDEMKAKIAKCARRIITQGDHCHFYFKSEPNKCFDFHQMSRYMTHNPYRLKLEYRFTDPNGKVEIIIKTPSIYYPLYECEDLWCDRVDMIPYHQDQPHTVPKGVFNLFSGFNAKLVNLSEEKILSLITPILTHIYEVWADSNDEYYKWILAWLQYPIVHLTRSGKTLILKGPQGCGKTFIFEFLRDKIYSRHSATIVKSFDNVIARFNDILKGKMLVVIDESASVADGSISKKDSNSIKSMITGNTLQIEEKFKSILEIPNTLNIGICTNSDRCADLETGDRRNGVFQCNQKYTDNKEYFDKLTATFTQEVGDALYTYFRTRTGLPDIIKVPKTELKQEMINMSKTKATTFLDGIFDGTIPIPMDYIHTDAKMSGVAPNVKPDDFIHNKVFHYIVTKEFYTQVYKPWHKDYSTGPAWSDSAFSDQLFRYNVPNIARARKRTLDINGTIFYISPNLLGGIVVTVVDKTPTAALSGHASSLVNGYDYFHITITITNTN